MKVKNNKYEHAEFIDELRPKTVGKKISYGNCILLAGALANNKKVLRMRRNSNFQIQTIPKKSIPSNAEQIMNTIKARKASLHIAFQ